MPGLGGSQTTTSSFPEELREPVFGQIRSNIAIANDIAGQGFQPYEGSRVAGLNPDQTAAIDRIRGQDWGGGSLLASEMTARRASTYVPEATQAAAMAASTVDPAAMMEAASIDRGDIRDVAAQRLADTDLAPYMNPYTRAVIDTTLADLGRQNDIVQNRTRARMAAAGAFGSQGTLAQTENDRAYLDAVARTTAGLNQANFAQAQQGAVGDITRDFQGQQANQQVDYAVAGQNAGFQQQANAANQAAANARALAQAQLAQQAAATNAGFAQDTGQFNASMALAGSRQQLDAANLLSGLGMQQQAYNLGNAQALLGAGTLAQGVDQARADADYAEYLRRQDHPTRMLGVRQSAIGGQLPSETTLTRSLGLGDVIGGVTGIADAIAKLTGRSRPG